MTNDKDKVSIKKIDFVEIVANNILAMEKEYGTDIVVKQCSRFANRRKQEKLIKNAIAQKEKELSELRNGLNKKQ